MVGIQTLLLQQSEDTYKIMNIFCSFRISDKDRIQNFFDTLESKNSEFNFIHHATYEENEVKWKTEVINKIKSSIAVIFFIGKDTYESDAINWEFNETIKAKKRPIIVFIDNERYNFPNFSGIVSVSRYDVDNILAELRNIVKIEDRKFNLLLEQFKVMVTSTEKITDQRLLVNNLFFTVTAAIISASFLLLKDLEFNFMSIIILLVTYVMAIIVTIFWKRLVTSYGQLNKGKFIVIAELENQMNIDLFQREWDILINKVGYKSNTETEAKIISRFRIFIIVTGIAEILYLLVKNIHNINPVTF